MFVLHNGRAQVVGPTGNVKFFMHWGISRNTGYWIKNTLTGTTIIIRPRWQYGERKCAYMNVELRRHNPTMWDEAQHFLMHNKAYHEKCLCTDHRPDALVKAHKECWDSIFPGVIMAEAGCCQTKTMS